MSVADDMDLPETQTGRIGEAVRPLVVDLDGTLIKSDMLVESFLHLSAKAPVRALKAVGKLAEGKAALKARLADEAVLDVATMPVNAAVSAVIEERRSQGGKIILASAADLRYVKQLAEHLGWFDDVLGTQDGHNLSGRAKAASLVETYGEGGFDYIGNSTVDLHVWKSAHTAYLAGGSTSLAQKLRKQHSNVVVLDHDSGGLRPYLQAMRPHQWLKNILVFVPSAAGHTMLHDIVPLLIAFFSFSLCASSVYITNDLLDLAGDRDHPRKRFRPFASGAASATIGIFLAMGLFLFAFIMAIALPIRFLEALGGYYLLTSAYSFFLKRKAVVDVITLACLYGMRIVAGGYASGTALSQWLEALAVFLFLSLALVKRCAELVPRIQSGKGEIVGRGYRLADLPVLESMAAAAGYNSALVLALYINFASQTSGYNHPNRLWLLCVMLLAWISRVLLVTRRGEMHDDPIVYAIRDKWSIILGFCSGLVVISAIL